MLINLYQHGIKPLRKYYYRMSFGLRLITVEIWAWGVDGTKTNRLGTPSLLICT